MTKSQPMNELTRIFWHSMAIASGGIVTLLLIIVFLSRDLPSLDQLENYGFDIVIGSRFVEGGMSKGWPLTRRLMSKVANQLSKMWLGINVNDSMSGFFALRKDLIKNLSFEAIGYKILLEILVKTKGAKVKEVPFVCINRQEGASKFSFSIINDYFKLLKILRKNVSYNAKNRV